jgi:hypothetical protein
MRAGFYDIVEDIHGDNTGAIIHSPVTPDECLSYVDEIDVASAQHRFAREQEEPERQAEREAEREAEPEEKAREQRANRKRKSDVLDMEVTIHSSSSSPNPSGTPSTEPPQNVSPPIKRSRKRKTEDEQYLGTDSLLATGPKKASKEGSRGSSVTARSVASNTTDLDTEFMGLFRPSSDLTLLDLDESPTPETRSSKQKKAMRGKAAAKRVGERKGKAKAKVPGKRTKKSTLAHSFTAVEMDSRSIGDDSSVIDDADKEVVSEMMPPSSPPPSTPLCPTPNDRQPSLESIRPPPPDFSAPLLPTPPPNDGDGSYIASPSGINGTDLRAGLTTQECSDALTEILKALIIERERFREESERRRSLEQRLMHEHEVRGQERLELERLKDLSKEWQTQMPSLKEDNRKLLDLHYASQERLEQVIKERDEITKERDDLNKRNNDLHTILNRQESKHMEAIAGQEKQYLDLQARYQRLLEKQEQDQCTPSHTSDIDLRADTKPSSTTS